MVWRSSAAAALIASPVATMLASCCLKTWNEIAGTPSTREIESGSRSRSTRVPRSAMRTTMPSRLATMMSANALASRTRPSTRTIASSFAPESRPTGMSALARTSAAETSPGVSW